MHTEVIPANKLESEKQDKIEQCSVSQIGGFMQQLTFALLRGQVGFQHQPPRVKQEKVER